MREPDQRASSSLPFRLIKMMVALPQIIRFIMSKPSSEKFEHAKEALVTNLQNDGVQEEKVRTYEAMIETVAHAHHEIREDKETYYKIDTYLIGGLGIVSLVLLQILATLGHPDVASSIALLSLAVALPCVAGFLLLSFLKKEYRALGYGSITANIAFIAELAGFISITALIWHVWFWAGIVFLPFAIILFMLSSFYKLIVVFMKRWQPLPAPEPDKASEQQPEEK